MVENVEDAQTLRRRLTRTKLAVLSGMAYFLARRRTTAISDSVPSTPSGRS
jgi:hypothetical protein